MIIVMKSQRENKLVRQKLRASLNEASTSRVQNIYARKTSLQTRKITHGTE